MSAAQEAAWGTGHATGQVAPGAAHLPRRPAQVARWCPAANLAAAALLVAAILVLRSATVVGERIELFGRVLPETCLYKQLHGGPCAGCGMTRSLVLAAQGRWADSLRRHASGVWIAGWLVGQLAARIALLATRPTKAWLWQADLAVSLSAMLLAVYLPMAIAAG